MTRHTVATAIRAVVTLVLTVGLALTALTPAVAQSDQIPAQVNLNTLYDASLTGPMAHRVDLPAAGLYAVYAGGSTTTVLTVTLPGGQTIEHTFSDAGGNFVFLDARRAGSARLEFTLEQPLAYDEYPHYAFVISQARELSLEDVYEGRAREVVLWSDPDEPMGMELLAFEAVANELVTVRGEGVSSGFSLLVGSETGMSAQSDWHGGGTSNDAVAAEIATDRGTRYAILIVEELDPDDATSGKYRIRFDRSELVRLEREELERDTVTQGTLTPNAELVGGRRGVPYAFHGSEGEEVSILLESQEFDSFLIVEYPDGLVRTDDDGAYGMNSLLNIMLPAGGTYTVYASSYGGREEGSYTLLVSDPATVDEIVSQEMADEEEWWDEPVETPEDRIVDVRRVRPGDRVSGRIETDGSVFRGDYVSVFELSLVAAAGVAVSLDSFDFDATLTLITDDGAEFFDDDGGSGTNSLLRIESLAPGTHRIYASSYDGYSAGDFELAVTEYEPGPAAENAPAVLLQPLVVHQLAITSGSPVRDGELVEVFEFEADEGSGPIVTMRSDDFDTYLHVVTPDGYIVSDDDGAGGTDSEVTIGDATGGIYRVYASSFGGQSTGRFTISLDFADVR